MASKLPPLVLFGYDSSAFTTKIRLTLRLLQLPHTYVTVPSMMPRPILVDNFNLTYRKIPVLAIGQDVFADTSLILEHLHSNPTLRAYRSEQEGSPEVHHDTRSRVLARLLSSHYTDRPFFRLTCGLMPSSVWRSKFGTDRAGLIGHKLDPDKLQKKVPRNLAWFDTYLSILEPLFAENKGEWFLNTEKPSAADLSLWYQLDWGEKFARGEGIDNLTGGDAPNSNEEGMAPVFNESRYPGLWAWFEKFKSYVDALPSVEARVEGVDKSGVDRVMSSLEKAERSEKIPMIPTSNERLQDLEESIGLKVGSRVSIAPDDTGRDDPTVGKLIAMSLEEAVILPEGPETVGKEGKPARIQDVRLHFPRVGFTITPVRDAKL